MDTVHISSLVLIPLIAALAPLLSAGLVPVVRIPIVVFEIVLGVLLGAGAVWLILGR